MWRLFKKQEIKNLELKEGQFNDANIVLRIPGGVIPIEQTQAEDIFIVGFPKSGNTLMQHIIAHLYYGLNQEGSRTMINLIAPDVYSNSHYFRFNKTCFFKSHERPKPNYKKVIYLIRDGREALLSYYHMMKNMNQDISLEALYEGKIKIYGGLWSEHIEAWEKNPYQAEILYVKYEDLLINKMEVLKRICDFIAVERSELELQEVVKYTSLEHMKMLEKRTDWSKIKGNVGFTEGSFVRNGEIASFKKEVPETLIKKFEEMNAEILYKYY